MNTVKGEKFSKQIIEEMFRHYDYIVEDFSFIKGNNIPWGLSKQGETGTKSIVHFIDLENGADNKKAEEEICSKFNCGREAIVTVILISENKSSSDIMNQINNLRDLNALQSNFVILDLVNREIHTSGDEMGVIAGQIASIINNNMRVKESKDNAVVTYTIMGINIIMFVISAILSNNIFDIDTGVLVTLGAKYNAAIIEGQWYRLFTCMFLHGGIIHITANMYSLYSIGPFVEKLYGKYKYAVIYIVCGVISSLFSFMFSEYVSIGASGAIFGLLGILFVFAIKERKRIGKGFLMNIASVVVMNLIIGMSLPGIDNFAHLGGLLSGVVLGYILKLKNR